MDKISITINGETFEAKGNNLMEAFDNFLEKALNSTIKEEKKSIEIPKPYTTVEDYLGIQDLNVFKCNLKDKVTDLDKKILDRMQFIKKYNSESGTTSFLTSEIINKINTAYQYSKTVKTEAQNIVDACEIISHYKSFIDAITKVTKHED